MDHQTDLGRVELRTLQGQVGGLDRHLDRRALIGHPDRQVTVGLVVAGTVEAGRHRRRGGHPAAGHPTEAVDIDVIPANGTSSSSAGQRSLTRPFSSSGHPGSRGSTLPPHTPSRVLTSAKKGMCR